MYVDIRGVGAKAQRAEPAVTDSGFGRWRVRDDLPVVRCGHGEGERGLEIGLVEAGEHAAGIDHLELRVEVHGLVDRIDEAVQALAGVHVGAVGDDPQLVLLGQVRQGDAGAVEDTEVEGDAVEGDGRDTPER